MRQCDIHFTATTSLDFTPSNEAEEAGITVFQRHDFHYDLLIAKRNGQRVLVLRKSVGDIVVEAAQTPVPPGVATIRVTGNDRRYKFEY